MLLTTPVKYYFVFIILSNCQISRVFFYSPMPFKGYTTIICSIVVHLLFATERVCAKESVRVFEKVCERERERGREKREWLRELE